MDRNKGVDLVKTAAIFLVIVVHIYGVSMDGPIGSRDWSLALMWGSAARAAVPMFFMCSGALLMNMNKNITVKKVWLRYIPRILAAMFVWSFIYKLYYLEKQGIMSGPMIWQSAKEVLLFNQNFHFYYLHMILLFYALLPVVRTFLRFASKRETEYALLIWFLTGIVYPTVSSFWPFRLLFGIPRQWLMNMTYASVGYGLTGYYINRYRPSKKLCISAAFFGLAFIFAGTYIMSVKEGQMYKVFLEGMSLGPACLSAGLFGLLLRAGDRLKGFLEKAVLFVSRGSFCVYLSHLLCIYLLNDRNIGIEYMTLTPALSIPLFALGVLCLCLGLYFVLSKIPVINKWLI